MNGNSAFQRGFNMVMQMHGVKTQREQIKKGLALRERATAAQEKIAKLKEKEQDEEDRLRGIKAAQDEAKQKEMQQFFAPQETGVPDFSPMAGPGGTVQMPSPAQERFGEADADFYKMAMGLDPKGTISEMTKRITPKGPAKPTALQGKIAETQNAYPWMSEEDVRKIALGTRKVVVNPLTNEFQLVDVGAQRILSLRGEKIPKTTAQAPTKQPKQTIYNMADLITGPVSWAKETGSVISGQFGGPIAKKTIQARQFVKGAQNDLIRALSINPRFPVAEMNRIRDAVRIEPKFFDNPAMLKSRIIAIDKYLTRRLENEKRTANDTTMPITDRRAAKQGANDIQNFLKILGAPKLKPGDIEDGYRFKGGNPADPNNWVRVK